MGSKTKVSRTFRQKHVKRLKTKDTTQILDTLTRNLYNTKYQIKSSDISDKTCILRLSKHVIKKPSGYRLIDLEILETYINSVFEHMKNCSAVNYSTNISPLQLIEESQQHGLASVLKFQCAYCFEILYLKTSNKVDFLDPQTSKNTTFYDVNVRSVWGTVATGGGAMEQNERFGVLNMPGLSQKSFSNIENLLYQQWHHLVLDDLLKNGVEERKLALNRGEFHNGIPAITVICDGGWSKRAHKHSYNASGGVAIIIGAATGKLLYIGVRNKYCSICSSYQKKSTDPPEHTCFKNWSASSQAMESDIIVEGFLCAESMHGLRYMRLIGDGDSSVFARVREEVPVWGREVKKLECANHACKCLRGKLENLVEDNPYYKGQNNLTKLMRMKIVASCRHSIKKWSEEYRKNNDRSNSSKSLANDLINSANHVFGDHQNCSMLCRINQKKNCPTLHDPSSILPSIDDPVENAINEQVEYWQQIDDGDHFEEIGGYAALKNEKLMTDLHKLLGTLAAKSDSLIENSTTNLAENWMLIRSKFDGGKFFNRTNRVSWHTRCYGAALRKNLGPKWGPQKVFGTDAGSNFHQECHKKQKHLLNAYKSKCKETVKKNRKKRKYAAAQDGTSKKARLEYGSEALQVVDDVSGKDLSESCQLFLNKNINLSPEAITSILMNTKAQSASGLWAEERRIRLTSSKFGEIIKRKPSINVTPIVKRLLYSTFHGNRITRKGLQLEKSAIQEYINQKKLQNDICSVEPLGLCISSDFPFLAASTDGLISSSSRGKGLLEIKHVLMTKNLSFQEACSSVNTFPLQYKNGRFRLKHTHNFYFQIQGQLNVFQYPWLDLIVRRTNPYEVHIGHIQRDETFWTTKMVPKLTNFYNKVILPELSCPRYGKVPGIREPGVWFEEEARSVSHTSETFVAGTESPQPGCSHSRRLVRKRFLNRQIVHEWVDETSGQSSWYEGTVLSLISGNDGHEGAVYEVIYDDDDESYEVDHLIDDYNSGSVKFIDL